MVRLTRARRELLSEKFADLANFAVAALVFGQAVGQEMFSIAIGLAGIGIWLWFLGLAFVIKEDGR